ncbi:TolC family protein [soil metagenome]
MNKKNISLVMLFFAMLQITFAQDSLQLSGPVSLKQCIDIALKNNADINRSGLAMEDSKVALTQSQGSRLPFMSASINHGLSQGRTIDPFTNSYINQNLSSANYNLGADLYLWNAGSVSNNIRANALNYEAGKMDWQQQKDNVTINVILTYLQVLNNQEQLNAAIQQADVTRKQAERLELLDKDGAIAPATYYDTKGQLATDEMNIIALQNAVETAKISLVELMNVTYSKELQLKKINLSSDLVLYDASSKDVYEMAMKNLALIKAADLRTASAAKSLKAAKGQLYPRLVLSGGLGTNYSSAASVASLRSVSDVLTDNYVTIDNEKIAVYSPQGIYDSKKISYGDQWSNNFNSFVGVGIQIPILNGLQTSSRVNQAKIQEKRSIINAKTTKTQLQQSVEQAHLNMNTAYERYNKLTAQVEDFGISFRAAEVKFNAGAINSVDYLLIKNKVDNSNINLIAAKYDYILRTKILDFYQGKLSL